MEQQIEPTDIYGLIGFPLGHSFSRQYFTEKFTREDIDAAYLNFPIESIDMLPALLLSRPRLRGLNVTIPYKSAVIPYLSAIEPSAAAIGAVNVVKINRDANGRLSAVGFNTDIIGFTDSIRPHINASHRRALVLGTGGASKAVEAGLKALGIEPTLVSRNPKPGCLTYADLTAEVMASHTVVVNTTPLGMWPKVDAAPDIPYRLLGAEHLCYDVVYNPDPTLFMTLSRQAGATAIGGMAMLKGQADAAWKIWNENSKSY